MVGPLFWVLVEYLSAQLKKVSSCLISEILRYHAELTISSVFGVI